MPSLILLQGGVATTYELNVPEVTIGRHPDCTIQLDSNMVSRKHARVLVNGSDFIAEDLGSGNGTFVNGKKIDGPIKLKHKDRLKLGPVLFRFEDEVEAKKLRSTDLFGTDSSVPSTAAIPATGTFNLKLTSGDDDTMTIMDTVQNKSGFGLLDVQPEIKLQAVIDISRSLAGTVNLDVMLPKILDTLFRVFPKADRGCILLKNEKSGGMIPAAQMNRRDTDDQSVKLSKTIISKVLHDKTGIISADASSDGRFLQAESISNLTIRSMMCVPMLGLDGDPIGIINLDTQNPLNAFKSDDLDLLMAVAGQAALSYENAKLVVSHMEKIKQDSEMQIARRVQRALLPEELPAPQGYDCFASYDSAQAVGGDYYDTFLIGDDLWFSFGDVAGKGVPASLVMSRMSSVVQSTLEYVTEVDEAVKYINNHMCAAAVEGRFVTYVLVKIDLKTNHLTAVMAGHMSPIIRKPDGTIEEFDDDSIGLPIGVVEDYPFEVVSRDLQEGELVVLYTDGVSEAMNQNEDLYTEDRVREFVKNGSSNAAELGKALLADVRHHANGHEQNDDITIMTFGRNG